MTPSPQPIYTAANCTPAYQLNWSYALFWMDQALPCQEWEGGLKAALEPDGIRLLKCHLPKSNVSQLLLSTLPSVTPQIIIQRTKGRLQYIVRSQRPSAFRRNYSLISVGSTKREKLEHYVEQQLEHHPYADPRLIARLRRFQIAHRDVDLSAQRATSHGLFSYNLHIVLETINSEAAYDEASLGAWHDMILKSSQAKGHLLSRASILPNHIHLLIGCGFDESPEQVVLAYLNNLAYCCGLQPRFRFSYYAGTFGEYDLGAIQ